MSAVHALPKFDDPPALLVQLTDCHLFGQPETVMLGVNTDASLRAVVRQIEIDGRQPDLLLATGDLSQDGEPGGYERFRQAVAGLSDCVRCLPGNHDQPETLRAVLGEWCNPITDIGAWRVVTLDTTVAGSNGGHLAQSQFDLLAHAVAQAPDRHVLVALHHNPIQVDSNWHDTMMINNAQALFQRLSRWPQVRMLLWGHVHQEFDRRRHNLRMLATPSTCFQFVIRDGKHCVDASAPGYRWIKLYSDGSMATGVQRVQDTSWQVPTAAAA